MKNSFCLKKSSSEVKAKKIKEALFITQLHQTSWLSFKKWNQGKLKDMYVLSFLLLSFVAIIYMQLATQCLFNLHL